MLTPPIDGTAFRRALAASDPAIAPEVAAARAAHRIHICAPGRRQIRC